MSYAATVFKVMIASPSDVAAERAIVRELLSEWNIVHAESTEIILLPVGWETHAYPEMGDRPQAIINKQILHDCDLLIGVFWTRIGTATGGYQSGSVEEIEEHVKVGKPAMLYFSSVPVVPDSIDPVQYRQLQEFRQTCQARGLYESYGDLAEFRQKFFRQLQLTIVNSSYFREFRSSRSLTNPTPAGNFSTPSNEAIYLLKEAAADPQATILNIAYLGGDTIQVRGNNLIEDGSDRSRAIWVGALNELEDLGYVESLDHKRQVFKITRTGYDALDRLP